MAVKNADGTWTSTSTYKGVTTTNTYDKNNKLISSTKSSKKSNGSSSNKSGSSSSGSNDMDYSSGNGYTNRETAFVWDDNGTQKTTYSNATRYEDALAEAIKNGQLSSGAKLQSATSYGTSTRSKDETGNTVVGAGSASSSKGGIYSNNDAKKDDSTGRNAYAEALGDMAMASSTSNPKNNGQTLDSYYSAMDDFYKYYNSLDEEGKNALYNNGTGTQSGAILTALRALENGYTPTGIKETATDSGNALDWNAYREFLEQQNGNAQQLALETALPSVTTQTTGTTLSGNPYTELASQMQNLYGDQSEAIKELYTQMAAAITESMEKDRASINEQYDDAAKEAYINHQRQQFALPGQLAASGLTGGASETANISLNNNYSNNLSNINTEKINANRELDKSITELQNQYNLTAGEQVLANSQSAIDAYLSLGNSAINYDYQAQRDAVEDARYNEEIAYSREQNRIANEQTELNNAITLAQMGDSSKLVSLGYTSLADAIAQERAYEQQMKDLDLKSAQAAYSNKVSKGSGTTSKGASEEEYNVPATYDSTEGALVSQREVMEEINKRRSNLNNVYDYIDNLYNTYQIGPNNLEYYYRVVDSM